MDKPFTAMEPAAAPPDRTPSKKSMVAGCGALFGMVAIVIGAFAIFGPSQEETRTRKQREAAEAAASDPCRSDLHCIGNRYLRSAEEDCRPSIERIAGREVRWGELASAFLFNDYRWKEQGRGIITYAGDRISVRNNESGWQPHIYECDFDTNSRTLIAARINPSER